MERFWIRRERGDVRGSRRLDSTSRSCLLDQRELSESSRRPLLSELQVSIRLLMSSFSRVHPRPQFLSAAVCSFPSVHQAASTVVEVLQWSIPVARIELLDQVQIQACNAYSNLALRETPTLFIEFHGSTEKEVADQTAAVEDICRSHEALDFNSGASPDEMAALWKARHNAYYAALAMRPGTRVSFRVQKDHFILICRASPRTSAFLSRDLPMLSRRPGQILMNIRFSEL